MKVLPCWQHVIINQLPHAVEGSCYRIEYLGPHRLLCTTAIASVLTVGPTTLSTDGSTVDTTVKAVKRHLTTTDCKGDVFLVYREMY